MLIDKITSEKFVIFFASILMILSVLSYLFIPKLLESEKKSFKEDFIGIAVEAVGDVKIRYGDSITWKKLVKKGRVYSNSYLYSGAQSSAKFAFLDTSTLELKENSMIFIAFGRKGSKGEKAKSNDSIRIGFFDGDMNIQMSKNALIKEISVDDSVVTVTSDSANIKLSNSKDGIGLNLSVYEGSVQLHNESNTFDIESGEKLTINKQNMVKRDKVSKSVMDEMNSINKSEKEKIKQMSEFSDRSTLAGVLKTISRRLMKILGDAY